MDISLCVNVHNALSPYLFQINKLNIIASHEQMINCFVFIAVYIDNYVMMSSDLYGTCRHCFYGTKFLWSV